jgi:hypothetical protein
MNNEQPIGAHHFVHALWTQRRPHNITNCYSWMSSYSYKSFRYKPTFCSRHIRQPDLHRLALEPQNSLVSSSRKIKAKYTLSLKDFSPDFEPIGATAVAAGASDAITSREWWRIDVSSINI